MRYEDSRRTLTAQPNVSAIRMAMKFRGMTKADLARSARISKGTVGNVLNGTRKTFNPETANAIAKALELPADELFMLQVLTVNPTPRTRSKSAA